MNLLSETDAAVLQATRAILRELERAADDATTVPSERTAERDLGRFAEACELAEAGVFNVLNTAHAYLGDARARAGMTPPVRPELERELEALRAALEARGPRAVGE